MRKSILKTILICSALCVCIGMAPTAFGDDTELLSATYPTSEPGLWTTSPGLGGGRT